MGLKVLDMDSFFIFPLVIYQVKILNISWFQQAKWNHQLLLSCFLYYSNWNILGLFRPLKPLRWAFLTSILDHFILFLSLV